MIQSTVHVSSKDGMSTYQFDPEALPVLDTFKELCI
jgi:hypothetical protein